MEMKLQFKHQLPEPWDSGAWRIQRVDTPLQRRLPMGVRPAHHGW